MVSTLLIVNFTLSLFIKKWNIAELSRLVTQGDGKWDVILVLPYSAGVWLFTGPPIPSLGRVIPAKARWRCPKSGGHNLWLASQNSENLPLLAVEAGVAWHDLMCWTQNWEYCKAYEQVGFLQGCNPCHLCLYYSDELIHCQMSRDFFPLL